MSYEPGGQVPFPEGQVPQEGQYVTRSNTSEGIEVSMDVFMSYTKIPILIYYGDNLPETDERPELYEWTRRLHLMRKWATLLNEYGGDATRDTPAGNRIARQHAFPVLRPEQRGGCPTHLSKWLYEKNLD